MNFQIVFCLCLSLITGILGKDTRIVGGTAGLISDFPHLASIRTVDTNQLICAGSIVSRWNILTAAHCLFLFHNEYSNIRVYTGSTSSVNVYGYNYEIDFVMFHPDFRKILTPQLLIVNDIAIIQLKHYIEFNDYQKKVTLPSRSPFNGNVALLVGWGVMNNPLGYFTSAVIRKAGVIVLDHEECARRVPFPITTYQFCTFEAYGVGVCSGDGGGPVMSNGEIYGIISYTFECARGLPDVHTQVYPYIDFILDCIED